MSVCHDYTDTGGTYAAFVNNHESPASSSCLIELRHASQLLRQKTARTITTTTIQDGHLDVPPDTLQHLSES